MKRKKLSLFLAIVGFGCLALNSSYQLEPVVAKVFILCVASLSLVRGLTIDNGVTDFTPEVASATEEKEEIDFSDINGAAKIASEKILRGEGKEGITIYRELIKRSADAKAVFLSQMASAEYSMGNYKAAINYYIQAMNNGADEDMMDDCILDSFKELFKKNQDEDYVKNYFDWMPKGAYHAEAKALLIGHYT